MTTLTAAVIERSQSTATLLNIIRALAVRETTPRMGDD